MTPTLKQNLGFALLYVSIITTLFFLGSIIYFIGINGIKALSWEFFTQVPRKGMTAGVLLRLLLGRFI